MRPSLCRLVRKPPVGPPYRTPRPHYCHPKSYDHIQAHNNCDPGTTWQNQPPWATPCYPFASGCNNEFPVSAAHHNCHPNCPCASTCPARLTLPPTCTPAPAFCATPAPTFCVTPAVVCHTPAPAPAVCFTPAPAVCVTPAPTFCVTPAPTFRATPAVVCHTPAPTWHTTPAAPTWHTTPAAPTWHTTPAAPIMVSPSTPMLHRMLSSTPLAYPYLSWSITQYVSSAVIRTQPSTQLPLSEAELTAPAVPPSFSEIHIHLNQSSLGMWQELWGPIIIPRYTPHGIRIEDVLQGIFNYFQAPLTSIEAARLNNVEQGLVRWQAERRARELPNGGFSSEVERNKGCLRIDLVRAVVRGVKFAGLQSIGWDMSGDFLLNLID